MAIKVYGQFRFWWLVAQVRAEKDVLLQGLDEQIWDLEAQLAAAAARSVCTHIH